MRSLEISTCGVSMPFEMALGIFLALEEILPVANSLYPYIRGRACEHGVVSVGLARVSYNGF